ALLIDRREKRTQESLPNAAALTLRMNSDWAQVPMAFVRIMLRPDVHHLQRSRQRPPRDPDHHRRRLEFLAHTELAVWPLCRVQNADNLGSVVGYQDVAALPADLRSSHGGAHHALGLGAVTLHHRERVWVVGE